MVDLIQYKCTHCLAPNSQPIKRRYPVLILPGGTLPFQSPALVGPVKTQDSRSPVGQPLAGIPQLILAAL